MTAWLIISSTSLFLVGGLAAFWVFTHCYTDTLLVRIGLSIIAVWSLIRAVYILNDTEAAESIYNLLHIGMAIFAIGFTRSLHARLHK